MTPEQAIAKVIEACCSAEKRSKRQEPEVDWIAPQVVPRGTLVDLHGDPKAGKSTLVAHLVRAIVDGGEFFGQATKKTRVIWFTEQPRPTFIPLLKSAGLYEHPDLLVLHHHEVMAATWAERVSGLMQVAKNQGADVLVVDTFTKLAGIRGEDENKSGPILTALDELEPPKAAGLTIILVRHDRKARGTVISAGRGSNAVAGEADVIYQIVKDEKKLGANSRRLLYEGRLGEIPAKRIITLEGGSYGLDGGGVAARHEEQQQDWELIASVLSKRRSERITVDKIAERLEGKVTEGKIRARLRDYRAAVEKDTWQDPETGTWEHVAPDGPLAWEGSDGRGGYWRACSCEVVPELEDCGECAGCRTDDECTARDRRVTKMTFVPDPECEVQFAHFRSTSDSPDPGDSRSPGSSGSNGGSGKNVLTKGGQGQKGALGGTSRSSRISRGPEVRKLPRPKKRRRARARKGTA